MSKFNVGDKVRVVKPEPYENYSVGDLGVVVRDDSDDMPIVDLESCGKRIVYDKELELVVQEGFKVGDYLTEKDSEVVWKVSSVAANGAVKTEALILNSASDTAGTIVIEKHHQKEIIKATPEQIAAFDNHPFWGVEEDVESEEVRSVSSTGAEKGVKSSRFSLLPMEALTEVANHYGVGATKYEDHNMRRGYEWSKSYDALMRHATQFWSGEDRDEETGSKHLAAVVFHALTLMEFMETHPEFDDRYKLES